MNGKDYGKQWHFVETDSLFSTRVFISGCRTAKMALHLFFVLFSFRCFVFHSHFHCEKLVTVRYNALLFLKIFLNLIHLFIFRFIDFFFFVSHKERGTSLIVAMRLYFFSHLSFPFFFFLLLLQNIVFIDALFLRLSLKKII